MSRNGKTFVMTTAAVLALSAVAASAAQAAIIHHFTTEVEPAIVTVTNEPEKSVFFQITKGDREVECTTARYEGTVSQATNTELTVTPIFSGCNVKTVSGDLPATVEANHCAYGFEGDTNLENDGGVGVECAGESEITITYEIFRHLCTIHFTPGTYGGGAHYTQTTNPATDKKDVTIRMTVKNIKWHETTEDPFSPCPGDKTGVDGLLSGQVTAQAYKDKARAPLTGTEVTTPGSHYEANEGGAINLELKEGAT